MTLWQAVMLGILQGVTEFLPVSSSGHLALAQMLIPGFDQPGVVFDVMLHIGTAIAVLWFERRELRRWLASAAGRRLLGLFVLGTLATAAVARPLRHFAEGAFTRPTLVACFLVVTGLVVGATRFLPGGAKGEGETTWREVAIVGLAQGVAIFPGLSRSGFTISAGLGVGLERSWVARFSFLLAIPAIACAALVELLTLHGEVAATGAHFWLACAVGAASAAVSGYIGLRIVIHTVSSRVFHRFAWYCLPLGIVVLLLVGGAR
ncbi:MAG: undecaprenyl-diphosphate phosphatase [Acidobacteriota bacterium]